MADEIDNRTLLATYMADGTPRWKALSQLLQKRGITQNEIALAVGCSPEMVQRTIKGFPGGDVAKRIRAYIASRLDLTEDDLPGREAA